MCIYKALDIRTFYIIDNLKEYSQNYIYKKHASSEITIDYASFLVATGADTRQWKPILHVPDIEDFVYKRMERGTKPYQHAVGFRR